MKKEGCYGKVSKDVKVEGSRALMKKEGCYGKVSRISMKKGESY